MLEFCEFWLVEVFVMFGVLIGWKKFIRGRIIEVIGRLGEFW